MASQTILDNVNYKMSKWHLNDTYGPIRPIVCVLCDRFIVPDSNKYLSFDLLNLYQELFYPNPLFNLSEPLTACYRMEFPTDVNIPQCMKASLQITYCLLSPRSTYVINEDGESGFTICTQCYIAVDKGIRPKFCIASNFCFGTPPTCLLKLTPVELAVISPVKTYGYCFCYTGGQKYKMKGSLAYYKVKKDDFIRSIGNLSAANANVVILVYGTMTKQQYRLAQQKNKLRIDLLHDAIRWLLDNNSEWKNSEITNIDEYVSSIQNPNFISTCTTVADVDVNIELTESYEVFFPDGSNNNNTGGQESIEVLQELVIEATLNNQDIHCRDQILRQSVRDYQDNNLINACLLQFPYGRGGMHEIRLKPDDDTTTTIDLEKYIEYLSMISQPHFHEGLFSLILYNMLMKLSMVKTANWHLRHKLNAATIANKIDVTDMTQAINATKVARGIYTEDPTNGESLLKAIDAVCNSAAHSNEASKKARRKTKAIQHKFGCPTIFLTVTPDDDNSYSIQILSGEIIDCPSEPVIEATDDELYERSKQRTSLRLKYPGLCAIYFELALDTIITEVLGWNTAKGEQDKVGLFGKVDAFTCSIEEQGRSTLHAHILIWISSLNNYREELHDPDRQSNAAQIIKEMIDSVSSTKCYFNDPNINRRPGRLRDRFIHDNCCNPRYGLPSFPTDDQLQKLRKYNENDEKLVTCQSCNFKWSFPELQDSYLKRKLEITSFSSIENEFRVKRLKTMVIEYQQNMSSHTMPNYPIDFGYNSHIHTPSCFKLGKSDTTHVIRSKDRTCRYRYPQRKKDITVIQNVTTSPLPWYSWNGTFVNKHIKEVSLKREAHDAFQNVYCPAISYSKLACNTNIAFLDKGPAVEYCLNYCTKETNYDETEPYEILKSKLEGIFNTVKYDFSDRFEAGRRLLAASFIHHRANAIMPTMASFLTRKKTRFIFSHQTVFCPLSDLRDLTIGEEVSVTITFSNCVPSFRCIALHYLCRPELLEHINPYEFYSNYEIVKCTKPNLAKGAQRFINTVHFKHTSYNSNSHLCDQGVLKRKTPFLVQVNQYFFKDSANFEGDILQEDTDITEEIEEYSQIILLLFLSYRCDDDLKDENKYTIQLRQAFNQGEITTDYRNFLQNIQDSKGNNFRFKVTNDDLDRASQPYQGTNSDLQEAQTDNIDELIEGDNVRIEHDLAQLLTNDVTEEDESFDMLNSVSNLHFKLDNILNIESVCNCLPEFKPLTINEEELLENNNFLESSVAINIGNVAANRNVDVLHVGKSELAIWFQYEEFIDVNLKDILGEEEEVNVMQPNGTAESIRDWAVQCKLDGLQQRAFEVITGFYILSYIYAIPFLDFTDDDESTVILREKELLEVLVGREKIGHDQLVCFLHGPGGSGKSTVLSLLQCYSKKYHEKLENAAYNRSIVITAMTGVAATIISGETAHSALYLNLKKAISPEQIELWTNTKLLVIDEISFANNSNIKKINERLSQLKDKQLPFGGINVIFCGDLRQLEPVNNCPLYLNHISNPNEFKYHVNCYIELDGKHRYKNDRAWGDLLARFREGKPTKADIAEINSRTQPENSIMPSDIKYGTYFNKERDYINNIIFQNKLIWYKDNYNSTSNIIVIFSDNIKINKNKKFVPLKHTRYFYENIGESNIRSGRHGRIDPVLKLYKGCEIMLTENIDVINGLANGTRAYIEQVVLQPHANQHTIMMLNNIRVNAVYASDVQYLLLKHHNTNIPETLFKVQPKQCTFKARFTISEHLLSEHYTKGFQDISMKAFQIPIIVNNATTGHKLQGTGVDKLFVQEWKYHQNWPYVILSRVKTIEGLYLNKDLSNDLRKYKMHPHLKSLIKYFQRLLPDSVSD